MLTPSQLVTLDRLQTEGGPLKRIFRRAAGAHLLRAGCIAIAEGNRVMLEWLTSPLTPAGRDFERGRELAAHGRELAAAGEQLVPMSPELREWNEKNSDPIKHISGTRYPRGAS